MSLSFVGGSGDRVTVTSSSSIDNLSTYTQILWVNPSSLAVQRVLAIKGQSGNNNRRVSLGWQGTAGAVSSVIDRATVDLSYTSTTAALTANTWCYIAQTFDSGGAANNLVHFYGGGLTTSAVNIDSTQTDGSGAFQADTGVNLPIGNNNGFVQGFPGQMAFYGLWNRVLTLGEIQTQQFNPHVTSGCVVFMELGFNGTGTQPDWSGNGNSGVVTTATQSAHVPITMPFGK